MRMVELSAEQSHEGHRLGNVWNICIHWPTSSVILYNGLNGPLAIIGDPLKIPFPGDMNDAET